MSVAIAQLMRADKALENLPRGGGNTMAFVLNMQSLEVATSETATFSYLSILC